LNYVTYLRKWLNKGAMFGHPCDIGQEYPPVGQFATLFVVKYCQFPTAPASDIRNP